MRIAFLTPEYPHKTLKNGGGLGTSIHNLTQALVAKGVHVSVIVIGQDANKEFTENGVNFYFFKQKKYRFFGFYLYRKQIEKYVNEIISRENIDLLEAPDWTGITAFMKFQVPIVIRFHGSDTYFCHLENRKQKIKNRLFEALAVKRATAFVAPTSFAGEVSARLFGIPPEKVTTIHHGLELDKFYNPTPEAYQEGKLLYIGTIIRKKGVLELPGILKDIVRQFPNAKLYLIGSDSFDICTQSTSTWKLVQEQLDPEIRDNIEYLGKVPYQEVVGHVKSSHVCLFPSYAETLGMVTIEAMALHKPIVNSNIGWANELIVDGESGFLVHPGNQKLFASKVLSLLYDKNEAFRISKNARERAEVIFDINKIVNHNIEFYKKHI